MAMMARLNCSIDVCSPKKKGGDPVKCPECQQVHLRPGYCPARNPELTKAIGEGRHIPLKEASKLCQLPKVSVTKDEVSVTTEPKNRVSVTKSQNVTLRDCVQCGEKFEPKRQSAKFCTPLCRQRWKRTVGQ